MPNLDHEVKYFRAPQSFGIVDAPKSIDRSGGKWRAGIIRGVSVITKGEALGHGSWVDDVMLSQVAEHINRRNLGVKARFTHPSMSGDGLGRHLGRVMNARVEGDQVIADQHFTRSSHDTPDGDLAAYLINLAEEDPESYGLSIVFQHDEAAQELHTSEHLNDYGTFVSPDPLNVDNLPHARVAEVRAADAVDEPAANPDGLFSREEDIARQMSDMASFALGLSDQRPTVSALGLDPDRVRGFALRFLSEKNLEIKPMATAKLDETYTPPQDDDQAADESATQDTSTDEGEATAESSSAEAPSKTAASAREEFTRFRESFGDLAADYFAKGLSYEEAQTRFTVAMKEENQRLRQQLAGKAEASGEESPVGFTPGEAGKERSGFASKIRFAGEA